MTELRNRPRQTGSKAMVGATREAAARITEGEGLDRLDTNTTAAKAGASRGSPHRYLPTRDAGPAELIRRDHLAPLAQVTLSARDSAA